MAWNTGGAFFILLLPLLIFFKHNDFPLTQPESLISFLVLLLVAIFFGMLMSVGRQIGKTLVVTFLLVLVIDIQTDWITTVGFRLFLSVIAMGSLSWLLKKHLAQWVVLFFGAMAVGTIIQAPNPMQQTRGSFPGPSQSSQPFVLHLILDEYAAPEALDSTFDINSTVSTEIQSFFKDWDFTIFSRAYSRFYDTNESIPNTLNRGLIEIPDGYWQNRFHEGIVLEQNQWFDRLEKLGYDLHVIQPNFIDFIGPDHNVQSSTDYHLNTINSLLGTDLSIHEKTTIIVGTYFRLSWFLGMFRDGYSDLAQSDAGTALKLPRPNLTGSKFGPLSTMRALDNLTGMLENAQPGQAVFAHLLLPHYPYTFNSDCSLKPESSSWLEGKDSRCEPARNNSQSRAERYPMYLAQIQCTNNQLDSLFETLKKSGVWNNAVVVLHGDHGSRLNRIQPFPSNGSLMDPTEFMDAFGTLVAVKLPAVPGKIDRSFVSLNDIFEQLFLSDGKPWPPLPYVAEKEILDQPFVLLNDRDNEMKRFPMPPFSLGVAGKKQ